MADVEHAQHGERAQRLAQHRPGDPERQRQLALARQAVAGLQAARQQQLAEIGDDLLGSQQVVGALGQAHVIAVVP